MAKFPELQKDIVFFIDNNEMKQGLELENRKICPPSVLLDMKENYPILICSMMNSEDIVKQIEQMKIQNQYYVLE